MPGPGAYERADPVRILVARPDASLVQVFLTGGIHSGERFRLDPPYTPGAAHAGAVAALSDARQHPSRWSSTRPADCMSA